MCLTRVVKCAIILIENEFAGCSCSVCFGFIEISFRFVENSCIP
nr:MAG TPA: chromosomal replication initiator protein [Caudoviricetes sp.]